MNLRRMEASDTKRVAQIAALSLDHPWTEKDFLDTLAHEYYRYFVAEEDGVILAFAGIMISYLDSDLVNIAVDPSYRKKGVGSTLMEKILSHAKEAGAESMMLEVRVSNQEARRIYQKYGFCEIDIRKGYYKDPVEDAIIMKVENITTRN